MIGPTRRELLARGGVAAGAAVLPAALLAAPALAQESDETDALESLVELEQAAELAYSLAAESATGADARLLTELGGHAAEHATALSEALDQLAVDPPDASEDPATYDSLKGFDAKTGRPGQLAFFGALELDIVRAYEDATPRLESPDLVVTGAQVAAAHAQAWVALRLAAGGRAPTAAELGASAERPAGESSPAAGHGNGQAP